MIIDEKVLLKDICEDDLLLILKWRNQETIREVMFDSSIITWKTHINWFNRIKISETAVSKVFYFEDVPFGIINITQIDTINNSCEWGFYIGAQDVPPGMGTILGYTALNYIFQDLKIRKVLAEVLDFNDKSAHFHKKMGFTQEGLLREQVLKNGKYIDVLLFGCLSSEWNEQSKLIRKSIERRLI